MTMEHTPPTVSDDLDALIGAIYDCVIDPSRWYDTIDRIRLRFALYNAILAVNGANGDIVMHVTSNVSRDMLAMVEKYASDVPRMWGGWARIAAAPLEEPIFNSDVRPPDYEDADYYRYFVAPQDIVDAIAIVLVRDAATVANLAFGVHRSAPRLTAAQVDELRILAPHIRRAVVISRLLVSTMTAAASFTDTLDASPAGIVLIDARRRILHANDAGRAMLAAGDPIRDADGLLELTAEVVPGALQRAIDTARDAVAGSRGMGVPARRRNGQPLTMQVMPLEHRHGANTPASAVAAVFVAEAVSGPATSADILSVLFDLTPAQARIFALVAGGMSLARIGAQLGIAPATAKSHLTSIYRKTGESSRSGLVKLAQDVGARMY
jgi:DNA-binding CsgD family transcriptional regulator